MTQCSTKHGDNGQENHAEKVLLCKQVQNKGKAFPESDKQHVCCPIPAQTLKAGGGEEFCILD